VAGILFVDRFGNIPRNVARISNRQRYRRL